MHNHARHFVRLYLTGVLCIGIGLAAFNVLVDPYNVYPWGHLQVLVPNKPNNDHRRAKAGLVRQHRDWDTLILGSSFAVVGMDATHRALADDRAFNLGLNGGKLQEQLGALRYAWAWGHPLKRVVLIYDNTWLFLPAQPTVDYLQSPFNEDVSVIEYQGSNLLGTQATEHSYHAVRRWRRGLPATDDLAGRRVKPLFGPGTEQREVFEEVLTARNLYELPRDDRPNLALFERFARFCLDRDIELTVLIPPCHVSLLRLFDDSGCWGDWTDGKRRLLSLATGLNQDSAHAPPITLWDFSGVSPYTTEQIPPRGDSATRLTWFWDPGHFKKELGDVMLSRVFGSESPPDDFGVKLQPDTIDGHLSQLRQDYEAFK